MSRTDDRAEEDLPVTSEVGGEGGSFADPTAQVATFQGRLRHVGSGAGGAASAATQATREGEIEEAGSGRGMIRYPTEPPSPPDAAEGLRVGTGRWRSGLIGAAAGAAIAVGINRLRQRRS